MVLRRIVGLGIGEVVIDIVGHHSRGWGISGLIISLSEGIGQGLEGKGLLAVGEIDDDDRTRHFL